MEPTTGTESSRLVSPRGGRADGSLRLKRPSRPFSTGGSAGSRSPLPLQPADPQPCAGQAPGPPAAEHRLRRLLPLHGRGGGYLAHSLAIMTDAAHLLTDVGGMSVSLFSLWVSNRPPTKTMTFGWHRSETLGALASVLSIWAVTAALVYLAAARIISNDYEIEARAMLATSACAVGVNLV
ncbi:hypothetical protein DUI87_29501 [Hirundo rustica rustica]|uniref:Probable proton-coupled zinc antiporter SLC30A3 n=1 Tax=Hirundo rustica rustica TaxID=333673 RepID=A0A3M0IZS5_HIRRU|nr:hypothetical protein DUI87_29501 [Hirundo rustica rustica]